MAGSYEELLAALNFRGADIAHQAGRIDRSLSLGLDRLSLQGEQQREGIYDNAEGRGMLRSTGTGERITDQRAAEQQNASSLEAAAADDLSDLNRYAQEAEANAESGAWGADQDYQRQLDDLLWTLGIAQSDTADLVGAFGGSGMGGSSGYAEPGKAPKAPDLAGWGF